MKPKVTGIDFAEPCYSIETLCAALGAVLGYELAKTLDVEPTTSYRGGANEYVFSTAAGKTAAVHFGKVLTDAGGRKVVGHLGLVLGYGSNDERVAPLDDAVALLAPFLRGHD